MAYVELLAFHFVFKCLFVHFNTEQVAVNPEEAVNPVGGGAPCDVVERTFVYA